MIQEDPTDLRRGDPADAGFSAERLARIADVLNAEVERDRMPGAVLGIVRGGRLIHLEAYGYRDKARGVPMTTGSLFWIASMTKPLTAAGALLLVEQGRLVLENEVSEYLPEFADRRVADLTAKSQTTEPLPTRAADRQPTVLDLLRHTAGIPEGLLGDSAVHRLYADAVGDGMTDLSGTEFIARLSELPLLNQPGALWHYGFGPDLVGLLIERIVGESFGSYLTRSLFRPLGMHDTAFAVPEDKRDRYAAALPINPVSGAPQQLPDLSIARFDSGGAGAVGTATDYLRFITMLLNEGQLNEGQLNEGQLNDNKGTGARLLGRKTVEYLTADQLDPATDTRRLEKRGWNPGYGYSLAGAVRRRAGGDSGMGSVGELTWPGAGGTNWWADPSEDLGVVYLAHTPSSIQTYYQRLIRALVLQAIVD